MLMMGDEVAVGSSGVLVEGVDKDRAVPNFFHHVLLTCVVAGCKSQLRCVLALVSFGPCLINLLRPIIRHHPSTNINFWIALLDRLSNQSVGTPLVLAGFWMTIAFNYLS